MINTLSRPRFFAQARQKHCQGLCDALEDNPVAGTKKYLIHIYCSRCARWMLRAAMKANGRCPCCNFRPRNKNFKQNKKVKVYY